MKVLLKNDVHNLGYAGEVINVANGYGRNYLIPKGLAVKATGGALREAEAWREKAAVRIAEIREEHEVLSGQINEARLVFYARAGETGKLYGSVTTADIATKLNEELGTDIDRRLISSAALRQLGEHKVTIKLGRDFHPQVTVNVHPLETESEIADDETEGEDIEPSEEVEMPGDIESTEAGEEADVDAAVDDGVADQLEALDEEALDEEEEEVASEEEEALDEEALDEEEEEVASEEEEALDEEALDEEEEEVASEEEEAPDNETAIESG
jgi:large subunit ribosomal protein L9